MIQATRSKNKPHGAVALAIPLHVTRPRETSDSATQPLSFGVPLPRGRFFAAPACRVTDGNGRHTPAQTAALCHWSDGSVKWLLVDAVAACDPSAGEWSLDVLTHDRTLSKAEALSVRESGSTIGISSGSTSFAIDRTRLRPFDEVRLGAKRLIGGSRVTLTDRKGRCHEAECAHWRIETAGPVRTTIVGEGSFRRVRGLKLRLRLSFFAATGLVKAEVTLHNPRRARHRGGLWDLGDRGSTLFRDLSLEVESKVSRLALDSRLSTLDSVPTLDSRLWTLYQDSSGGVNWNSANHRNRDGRVPCRFRGYRLVTDGRTIEGLRAEPSVTLRTSAGNIGVAVPEFWQQFPKAITVDERRIRIGLFPGECDDPHELQGGERKTHTVWLQFDHRADVTGLAWVHEPAVVRPDLDWCEQTQALPTLRAPNSAASSALNGLLQEALEGDKSVFANRERVDEYGWRNYGDIFADHEQAYYSGSEPLISHYNNQYDMVQGFLLHYLRSGDHRWWDLADALARHVVDIDLYHTERDKPAYNGGLFWMTDHYVHAHLCTHRTYSRFNSSQFPSYGGGPCSEHNYTTGLLLHHCLTGSADSRDAVLQLADWVIAMDDGRRTVFGIVDDGPTGLASGSGDYQGPHRAGGNSVNALLDAWLLSHRRRYLDYAERLIRRCVHPDEDVAVLDLLNVERRWSYTVFLTSLAKYIEVKAESGRRTAEDGCQRSEVGDQRSEIGHPDSQLSTLNSQLLDHSPLTTHHSPDDMAAYAQASLLRYAEWMLDHEQPYFDQVEKLEFPTETWAAQEFRKANVLRLAARHAAPPLRDRLMQRGRELADRAWKDLYRFETRACARSLALVMTEGLKDCVFRSSKSAPAARPAGRRDDGPREPFMSQRCRIKRSLRRPQRLAALAVEAMNPARWMRFLRLRGSSIRSAPQTCDGVSS